MPKIGFVILAWNSEKVIENCLIAIDEMKKIKPFVVLVDNGSSDNTLLIIESYVKKDPEKYYLINYKNNKGTTFPRNEGIRFISERTPDFYCILDSDTIINDETFLKMIEELNKNPQYGLIGPKLVTSSGLIQMSARAFPTLLEKIYKAFPNKTIQKKGELMEQQLPVNKDDDSYPVDYLMSACWLIKPDVLKKVGLLDEKIFYAPEDAEYCIRVWKKGFIVAFCPKVQIIHEWQRLSKKKLFSKINWEHIKGLIYMFNKHQYLFTTKRLKKQFDIKKEI